MTFSIIIPTFNRADVLSRTLMSIVQLDSSPDDFDIFVVDNGSTDSTREVFEAMQTSSPRHNWRYALETMPGLFFETILFTGDHRFLFTGARGTKCVPASVVMERSAEACQTMGRRALATRSRWGSRSERAHLLGPSKRLRFSPRRSAARS